MKPWGHTPQERERLERRYELVPLSELSQWAENPRFNDAAVPKLMKLIEAHGFAGVIIATPDGVIRAGHTRYKAVQNLGWAEIPVEWKDFPSQAAAEEYALADNKSAEWADWDHELLGKLFKRRAAVDVGALVAATGFTPGQIKFVGAGGTPGGIQLRERFGAPPFTILNAQTGDWPERKREWIGIGIQSEIGREGHVYSTKSFPEQKGNMTEKSVFDPVLCELMYTWFCPPGGQVVDPFAGGSVRGVVSGALGYRYWGSDLGKEQIAANEAQRAELFTDASERTTWVPPVWFYGDAAVVLPRSPQADFIFTCPPYGDLEEYGNGPADLSGLSWDGFATSYRRIVTAAVARLRPNRFACYVVGNYRDRRMGFYRDLVGLTVDAFAVAGAGLYNDAIFCTPLGTLPMRAGRAFAATRKLGKAHQNILIFCKGDPRAAAKAAGATGAGVADAEVTE